MEVKKEVKVDVAPVIWQRFTTMAHNSGKSESQLFTEIVEKAFIEFVEKHPETLKVLGLAPPEIEKPSK